MHTPRYLPSLLFVIALGLLMACDEREPLDANRGYSLITRCIYSLYPVAFADLPFSARVEFNAVDEVDTLKTQFRISFGDGKSELTPQITEISSMQPGVRRYTSHYVSHTYGTGGDYRLELYGLDDRLRKDTIVTIHKAPKKLGSAPTTYSSKFLWQDMSNEYHYIHVPRKPDLSIDRWAVTKLTPSLDSVSTGQPVDAIWQDATNFVLLPSGNFIQVRRGVIQQFDNTGRLLGGYDMKLQMPTGRFITAAFVNGNLLIAGDSAKHLIIRKVSLDGKVLLSRKIAELETGTRGKVPVFTSDGDLALYYVKGPRGGSEIYIYDLNGNIKSKTSVDLPVLGVFPVDSGLVVQMGGQDVVAGTMRMDLRGKILWVNGLSIQEAGDESWIFGEGDDTWIFGGQMFATRINSSGKFVWDKYLTTNWDYVAAVTRNKAGNFVIVGRRSCLLAQYSSKPCAAGAFQFILLEVDKDGNIIDH
ncbi:MAG TPA: hypothetical protein VFE50_01330 [Cyclobacteriaceae bacterium]|nr:hypothetical protein [Cyclobacteriaceae bacterium]